MIWLDIFDKQPLATQAATSGSVTTDEATRGARTRRMVRGAAMTVEEGRADEAADGEWLSDD